MTDSTVTILLSGGLDSTCLAAILKRRNGCALHAITVDYGQRHANELDAARDVAAALDIDYTVAALPALAKLLPGSMLTSGDAASPVVAGRNAILLAVAGGFAAAHGSGVVAYAAHGDDHHGFPDCRPEFAFSMAKVLETYGVALWTPYLNASKAELVRDGLAVDAPVHLSWSCYGDGLGPCRQCLACLERQRVLPE